MRYVILMMSGLLLGPAAAFGQDGQRPCDAPGADTFDFWLGAWTLAWPGGQGGTPEGTPGRGTNTITRVLDDCIVEENFASATGYTGQSWSAYVPASGEWRQTWVDNQGSYLVFSGAFRDGVMELRTPPRTSPDGITFINRMLWHNITDDALDWSYQRSADDGRTWTDVWNIRYTRQKGQ